jgi:hypothetical protein
MRDIKKSAVLTFSALLVAMSAAAQEDEYLMQETVLVKGTRSDPMLAGVEPEVTLDVADIRSYGATSLGELLAELAPLTDSAGGGPPAILLNGRRVTGLREIRSFPPEALRSVEILPEEVALKYGFRGNQKVINFILRDKFHALTSDGRIGGAADGKQIIAGLSLSNLRIRNERRWNVDFGYDYQEQLLESDRDVFREGASAADRSLQPELHKANLTASHTHILPGDIGATYIGGLVFSQADAAIARRDLSDALTRQTDEWGGELGIVLNKVHEDWNWTLNGGYERRQTVRETEPSPETGFGERTKAVTDTATLEGILFRKLFDVPAGAVVTTLKGGGAHRVLFSSSERSSGAAETELLRDEVSAQINLDVPIFQGGEEGFVLGKLSLNGNGRIEDLSDAGVLQTYGLGLTWRPTAALQIIASTNRAENAPSVENLGDPLSITQGTRVFDFTTGETVANVARISGGSTSLDNEVRRVNRLNLSWDLSDKIDLSLNAVYTELKVDNPISQFPGFTPAIEAAFPDRILRDDDGNLLSIDTRPLNLAELARKQFRYGFSWSHSFPTKHATDLSREDRTQLRDILFKRLDEEDRERIEQRIRERESLRADGGQEQRAGRGARDQDVRRGGGRRGDRGARNQGRIFASVYHTLTLEESVVVSDGDQKLDLLAGDAISDRGGSSEHQLTAQVGYADGPWGAFTDFNWQSRSEIDQGTGERLAFEALATTNLRLQYNFERNPKLLLKYPALSGARLSLNIRNLFDQKQTVRKSDGSTPTNYQADLLDPRGQSVTLSFRKLLY